MIPRACIGCGRDMSNDEDVWMPGEWLLFGNLLACSPDCAAGWAEREGLPFDPARDLEGPHEDEEG